MKEDIRKISCLYFMLPKREMQVLDIIYRGGSVSARDVQGSITAPLSYSSIRTILRSLVRKGVVSEKSGKKIMYCANSSKSDLGKEVLKRIVNTYHDGSTMFAVKQLLALHPSSLTSRDLDDLSAKVRSQIEVNKLKTRISPSDSRKH